MTLVSESLSIMQVRLIMIRVWHDRVGTRYIKTVDKQAFIIMLYLGQFMKPFTKSFIKSSVHPPQLLLTE